jgi:hypothetical protein
MLPDQLKVALKEWAVVCDALRTGRQAILLRKGGIVEAAGEFKVEHESFVLFPTFVHQDYRMLKPEVHGRFQPAAAEPDQVTIDTACEIVNVVRVGSHAEVEDLDAEHVWTRPLIDMRFSYKPERPLYLLVVRAYALPAPVTIANTPAYAGCKSWVPLAEPIDCRSARPAIEDARFEQRRQTILDTIAEAPA